MIFFFFFLLLQMIPTERPSFTEIYLRLCHINHRLSTSTKQAAPSVVTETRTHRTGALLNGDCGFTHDNEELTKPSNKPTKESELLNECKGNTSEESTHVPTSNIQNLAPTKLTSTSRVLRALYAISAAAVLITLAVLNFWQSIFVLLWVLVPLTLFTLFPVSIQKWWRKHSYVTFKVSAILCTLGRRLSSTKRNIDFSDTDIAELKSEKSCGAHTKSQQAANNENSDSGLVTKAIDPKHDIFTIDRSDLQPIVSAALPLDNCSDVSILPKTLRTRRRLSKTLPRTGSFSLHDSIEEHVDESRA